jgi:methylase of polypeptide subunit release factors
MDAPASRKPVSFTPVDPTGDALLQIAAEGKPGRLAELRARVAAGEPAPYAAGFLFFRGRRFAIDARAYITDPELSHLVDVVGSAGRALAQQLGRPLTLLEFGVGAGTLAISVKLENAAWTVHGLDVDADALALAGQNARELGAAINLLHSDFLSAWPRETAAPDVIFGDPPWGTDDDVYDAGRPAVYYRHMPAASAFPPGGSRCGVHDELIAQVRARRWRSLLVLNYGVLPAAVVAASAAPLREYHFVSPRPNLRILVGRA